MIKGWSVCKQNKVSEKNIEFWDNLCGSHMAKSLGISDASIASLKKFDDWYFDFYPYLFDHIPFSGLEGKNVLEIGLGYGTVSQRLAECGAFYSGLDIAHGPVSIVNHRLKENGLAGEARQGSILEHNLEYKSFDSVIAIGCLHHTGNLKLAIDECWKLLRPGGTLILMVYYAYSYRRYRMAPIVTAQHLFKETFKKYRGVVSSSKAVEREAYDTNESGDGAPYTDWVSINSLQSLCKKFSYFTASIENIDRDLPFILTSRERMLKTSLPHFLGLDLYATVTK